MKFLVRLQVYFQILKFKSRIWRRAFSFKLLHCGTSSQFLYMRVSYFLGKALKISFSAKVSSFLFPLSSYFPSMLSMGDCFKRKFIWHFKMYNVKVILNCFIIRLNTSLSLKKCLLFKKTVIDVTHWPSSKLRMRGNETDKKKAICLISQVRFFKHCSPKRCLGVCLDSKEPELLHSRSLAKLSSN